MNLRIEPDAYSDMQEIFDWYHSKSAKAANKFRVLLKENLSFIKDNPYSSVKLSGLRRKRMIGFPYMIYYSISNDYVNIIAVLHNSRKVIVN
ncbi:MAG: hypothetical protein Kapaf2KO_22430 [Candidatus Kapaibacteriales bacterium]